jgi:glycosyltransferase involved in cell wall biosynthesis
MRIAILNWRDLAHPDAGGAEIYVDHIARRWTQDGHQVRIYSSRSNELPRRQEGDGIEVVRTGHLRDGTHHWLAPRAVRMDGWAEVVLESINTIPYFLPSRSRGMPPFLPLVHQMASDVWAYHLPGPLAAAARWLEPRLYRPYRDALTACVSPSTASDLRSAGLRRVVVVPEGGLGERPKREKEADPTLLFVGRLSSNKRPEDAVRAFELIRAELPGSRLWVIGDGPLLDGIRRGLPVGASLLGRVSSEELEERMGQAHLLLCTSVREGWGLVVTESNALGTPAVAYDVPGLRDSVRNGVTGILTEPTPNALARSVLGLLRDPERYSALQGAALAWGREHTWERTAGELLLLLGHRIQQHATKVAR